MTKRMAFMVVPFWSSSGLMLKDFFCSFLDIEIKVAKLKT